jgi:hypothetical protein
MKHHLARALLLAATLAGPLTLFAENSTAQDGAMVATYRNERHGFALAYPTNKFLALPPASDSARMFVSRDGNARLLAGALRNIDSKNLRDYRDFLLSASYPGAQIDYAPVRDKWFVLSGTRGNTMFYERVTFTCGGRTINSWAMLYPAAERNVYDPIINQVHRSYRTSDEKCQ